MNNQDSFKKILGIAVHAPSGDNSQPWRFKLDKDGIMIFNIEDKDPTLYNFRQRGSYFAHGALVENVAIAAGKFGYSSSIEGFPGPAACTARVVLKQSSPKVEPLYDAIFERATNRKLYRKEKLYPEHKNAISGSARGYDNVSLVLAEDNGQINELSKYISLNERLVMENRRMHDFLFGVIRWSREEESENTGLYIETMEFPAPQKFLLKILKYWPLVRILNLFGFSRLVPKGSAQLYKSSSAIGAIVLRGDSNGDFLSGGRIFQRIWLTATNLGLSIQPITAIPYLAQRVSAGEISSFSPGNLKIINYAYGNISRIFGINPGETIAMIFRIGYDGSPTARSSKRPPEIIT